MGRQGRRWYDRQKHSSCPGHERRLNAFATIYQYINYIYNYVPQPKLNVETEEMPRVILVVRGRAMPRLRVRPWLDDVGFVWDGSRGPSNSVQDFK